MKWLIAILITLGLYTLCSSRCPGVYPPARKALRCRAPRPLTSTQVLQNRFAMQIAPKLNLDPIRRAQTESLLRNLGHTESPELFEARAITQGLSVSLLCAVLLFFSVPLGLLAMICVGVWYYRQQEKTLEKELQHKRAAIERELPQFASTIRQQLGTTRDIVAILTAYRRVCGPVLSGEIDTTLNDIMTGNAERALRALESRVGSARLGQLTRGLIGVLHGEEQRLYFDILADEFAKAEDEAVERELQQRPQKLNPYMAMMFCGLVLMIAASIGTDIFHYVHQFFG